MIKIEKKMEYPISVKSYSIITEFIKWCGQSQIMRFAELTDARLSGLSLNIDQIINCSTNLSYSKVKCKQILFSTRLRGEVQLQFPMEIYNFPHFMLFD